MVHKKLMEERWDVHKDSTGKVVKPCRGCDSLRIDTKDYSYWCSAGPLCMDSVGIIKKEEKVSES